MLDKFFRLFLIVSLFAGVGFADNHMGATDGDQEETSAMNGGVLQSAVSDEGAVKLSNVLISDFEDADRWFGAMSVDNGLIQVEKRKGAVREIRESKPDSSKFVLGAKIHFFKSGYYEASMEPPAPIIIPGYTKKLTVWAYGRGYKHKLYAVVRDFKGRVFKFSFGQLTFVGWKKLEADIPSDPTWPFFSQDDIVRKTVFQTHGVTFLGFLLEFDPKDSYGRFYVYLDDFVAESNVYLYDKEMEIANIPEDERLEPLDDW